MSYPAKEVRETNSVIKCDILQNMGKGAEQHQKKNTVSAPKYWILGLSYHWWIAVHQ